MSCIHALKGKPYILKDVTQNTKAKTQDKIQNWKHGSHKLQTENSKHPCTKHNVTNKHQ